MVKQYLQHCKDIITSDYSSIKGGGKGMSIVSLFGYQNEYDLRNSFPLLTSKKMGVKQVAKELLWFMSGETSIKPLIDEGVPIWNTDAFNHNLPLMEKEKVFPKGLVKYSEDWFDAMKDYVQRVKEEPEFAERFGDLGPVYGAQWRHWKYFEGGKVKEVDQLENLIEGLRKKPLGKKHIVTAWNPGDIPKMALPPCHLLFQATANEEGEMDLQMYQRSCDQFLGVPYNIASYAMLTTIIAQEAGLTPRKFSHVFGDSHFYLPDGDRGQWYRDNFPRIKKEVTLANMPEDYQNILEWINKNSPPEIGKDGKVRESKNSYDHLTAILEQYTQAHPLWNQNSPQIEISKKPYNKLTSDDFKITNYNPAPAIRRAMAV